MFKVGQQVTVYVGNRQRNGTIEAIRHGMYQVWFFDDESVGWFYGAKIRPFNQLSF